MFLILSSFALLSFNQKYFQTKNKKTSSQMKNHLNAVAALTPHYWWLILYINQYHLTFWLGTLESWLEYVEPYCLSCGSQIVITILAVLVNISLLLTSHHELINVIIYRKDPIMTEIRKDIFNYETSKLLITSLFE